MTSQAADSQLRVVASGQRDLVLNRAFAAPAPLVFATLTRPNLLRRWHGANGWQLTVCEVDLRVGGAWRFVSSGPDGAEMEMRGLFREVEPPVRLVQTEIRDDWTDGAALVTTVLDEADGRTAMTVTVQYSTTEIRDLVLRSPMERGAGEAYERLAAELTTLTPNSRNERPDS
ncbi:MAG: SRPBCC family protein [Stackebrandtia sp.]